MARPTGLPKTGGRKKGSTNKKKVDILPIAQALAVEQKKDPMQVLFEFLDDEEKSYRFAAAKELCQYYYAKKKAVEVQLTGNLETESSLEIQLVEDVREFLKNGIHERKPYSP